MRILLASCLILSGCATGFGGSSGVGGAVYHYVQHKDGSCEFSITSGREATGGGSLAVGEDCTLSVHIDRLGPSDSAFRVIEGLLERIP